MSTVTAPPLAMTDEQRSVLEVMARSTSLGHRKVVQAKALLLAGDLYDGEQTSMKTARFLAAQIRRLHEAAIQAAIRV